MGEYDGLFDSTSKTDMKQRMKHPRGWEPGAVIGEDDGFIVANPRVLEPGEVARPEMEPWEDHLRQAGINPDLVRVIPPVEVRTWDAMVKNDLLAQSGRDPNDVDPQDLMVVRKMVYFKAKLERRRGAEEDPDLREWIRKWKPTKPKKRNDDVTVCVPWGDWQVGKTSSKEGTPETYERIVAGFERTVDYIRTVKPSRVVVASLGDLIENCAGFYPQQTYTVDLSLTEQEYLVQTLLVRGLKELSDLADEVLVLPVGGNHGENRADGKSFTTFADNFDVSVHRHVRDILSENDRFSNVGFHIPSADLTQTLDVHGHILGLVHGHQATSGATVSKKIDTWWEGQMRARAPIGDADILLNGHYHHLLIRSSGPRTHIQIPSMDMGSEWWDDTKGGREPQGQVVFTITEDGWDNLRVL